MSGALRLVLALAIGVATFLVAPAPAQALGRFTDDDGNIHESSVEAIAAAGITLGCNPPTNDRYCPTSAVSRAEMATFLVRALPIAASSLDAFTDDDSSVHEANVQALAKAGITLGCNPSCEYSLLPRSVRYPGGNGDLSHAGTRPAPVKQRSLFGRQLESA